MLKEIFYDWYGYNVIIFDHVHMFFKNPIILYYLDALSTIGKAKYIHWDILVLFLVLLGVSIKHKKSFNPQYLKAFCVFVISLIIGGYSVEILKSFFGYIRPVCSGHAIADNAITMHAKTAEECTRSFPSGHATGISMFVFSLWPILHFRLKTVGVILFASMMVARVAEGGHWPADMFYGAILGWITVEVSRKICEIKMCAKAIERLRKLIDRFVVKKLI